MNAIGAHPEDWDKYFRLIADIDLSAYTDTQFNIIGSQDIPFTGVFDGNGHTVSNFTYTAINESYIGLFGYIDSPFAEIKNLGLIDPNVMCDAVVGNRCLGSLVGDIRQGTGKTTAEMQTLNTFTAAGWDFNTPIWKICEGRNYPKLAWQIPIPGDLLCPDGVDLSDYSFFADHWRDENCGLTNHCDKTDLDFSGAIDWRDLKILCAHWLAGK